MEKYLKDRDASTRSGATSSVRHIRGPANVLIAKFPLIEVECSRYAALQANVTRIVGDKKVFQQSDSRLNHDHADLGHRICPLFLRIDTLRSLPLLDQTLI